MHAVRQTSMLIVCLFIGLAFSSFVELLTTEQSKEANEGTDKENYYYIVDPDGDKIIRQVGGGSRVGATVGSIDNGRIHVDFGTNQEGGGPGVTNMWSKEHYPSSSANNAHDIMWYGSYQYIKMDGTWSGQGSHHEETGGQWQAINGTAGKITWNRPKYKLVMTVQTIPNVPVFKCVFNLTNIDGVAHTFKAYFADDYCRGGSGGSANDNIYLWNHSYPISSASWFDVNSTRSLISQLNVASGTTPADPYNQDWTFVACYKDDARYYAGKWMSAIYIPSATGEPPAGGSIIGQDDSVGILANFGSLGPGQSAEIEYFNGVSNRHNGNPHGADELAAYIVPIDYGVDVSQIKMPDDQFKTIEPSQSVIFNLSVKNTGIFPDKTETIYLNLSNVPPGWNASLVQTANPNVEFATPVILGGGQSKQFSLKVTAPPTGSCAPGDFADIGITAIVSEDASKVDSVLCIAAVQISPKVSLSLYPAGSPEIVQGEPGATKTIKLELRNIGNIPDNYTISMSDAPYGWDLQIAPTAMHLSAGGSMVIELNVTIPPGAASEEACILTVTGTSLNFPTVKDSVQVMVIASATHFLEMNVDVPEKMVVPGQCTTFNITIKNNGNANELVELSHGNLTDWNGYLSEGYSPDSVVVPPNGGTKVVTFTLCPPSSTAAWRVLVVKIRGQSTINPAAYAAVEVKAITTQKFGYTIEVNPLQQVVNPGGDVNFSVTVMNQGNGRDRIRPFIIDIETGWGYNISMDGMEFEEIALSIDESRTFDVSVKVPLSAKAGTYQLSLNVSSLENLDYNQTENMNVVVTQFYKIDMTTKSEQVRTTPGRTINVTLTLQNLGNGEDTISMSITGDPKWTYNLSAKSVVIAPNNETSVFAFINVPKEVPSGQYAFQITATSKDGKKKTVTISVLLCDLAIHSEKHTSNLKSTDIAKFDVNISNEGFMPATNVTVELLIDGILIDSETLERVHLSRTQRVVFTWTAKEGEHLVKIVVDPTELIPEISEENNVKEFKVRVAPKTSSLIPGFESYVALTAIALALVCLLSSRRREI